MDGVAINCMVFGTKCADEMWVSGGRDKIWIKW